MRGQVEVGTVGDAFELTPIGALEAELVFDVDGALRIVGQLLLRMLVVAQVLRLDAEVEVPLGTGVDPVLVPGFVLAGLDEEFHFHLLELTGTEDEVARGDLVTEGLAHVGDAERRLLAGRGHHVLEVHEDALRGFRTQVVQEFSSSTGPRWVRSIMLKSRGSVHLPRVPQSGHTMSAMPFSGSLSPCFSA